MHSLLNLVDHSAFANDKLLNKKEFESFKYRYRFTKIPIKIRKRMIDYEVNLRGFSYYTHVTME